MSWLNLESIETYEQSCLEIVRKQFHGMSMADVAKFENEYNVYPGLSNLQLPRDLIMLEDMVSAESENKAKKAILSGEIMWEHTAAGEATRLQLGPKYMIHPHDESVQEQIEQQATENGSTCPAPNSIMPMRLGARHMWQGVFEIRRLAAEAGEDPKKVLSRQKFMVIINEWTCETILDRIVANNFLGLDPDNCFFLKQKSFYGITEKNGQWNFDPTTEKRLHNHGQMAMQKTMNHQVFTINREGQRKYLTQNEFFSRLDEAKDLVSYNIEDLGYLTQALDFVTIGLALELGDPARSGGPYGMTMEIVPNNPDHPVKGGFCAYDEFLGHNVMLESFRLRKLNPEEIKFLNKNFNHYIKPGQLFRKLHNEGIFMPIAVKNNALYFQPVQGDLNFLTKTAFITRRTAAPLRSWKSPADTPAALEAMKQQDKQPGFAEFVRELNIFEYL